MNAKASESGVLASIIEADGPLPFELERILINCPEVFDDQRHGYCAIAVRKLRNTSTAVNLVSLERKLSSDGVLEEVGIDFLRSLSTCGLPVAIAVVEAETLWKDFEARKGRLLLSEAIVELDKQPDMVLPVLQITQRGISDLLDQSSQKSILESNGHLTLKSPKDISSMSLTENDSILGDRLFCRGQSLVIAAAGGAGKSRFSLQLAAATISGLKFLALDTNNHSLKWMFLQTENSIRRLQDDLNHIRHWLTGDQWEKFNSQVLIHTIEHDKDTFVSLDNPDNINRIEEAVQAHKPDVVVTDPLNDFGIGDINKDTDMRATVITLSRTVRKGDPSRAILILHHSLTGQQAALRAVGYDRASFARNSKALFAWTRGQINLAAADENSNDRLIVACGKCSDGREFQPFAAALNPDTMIYECDESIDVSAWKESLRQTGNPFPPLTSVKEVALWCRSAMPVKDLAKVIMDNTGCSRPTAYRWVNKTKTANLITVNSDLVCFLK